MKGSVHMTVLVCALGYFVDIYDLLLFGIVRVPSLIALGVPEDQLMDVGLRLLNFQMAGLLIGGIFWGVLGDKHGRKSVLFGSIFLYSIANIANAFVTNTEQYAWLRLIAGIGLAGELGAAVTLVSEVMSKETRGYGTAIVASVGILGAVAAFQVGDYFDWKIAYIVGGCMGLALLLLRANLLDSEIFDRAKHSDVRRGDFLMLFTRWNLFKKYFGCIAIGVPLWFIVGILVTFSPEITKELGLSGVSAGRAIMWTYAGAALGDLLAGLMSQWLRSRRKVVLTFLLSTLGFTFAYVNAHGISESGFYTLCFFMGIGVGYWAIFVTVAAEQFGTNMRATVATTAPNFVRGAVIPMTLSFQYLQGSMSLLSSALAVGLVTIAMAFFFAWKMEETFGKDLDYVER